ncbi:hypothetical protein EIN_334810 [Entamoeba invadens IP1]|uniref:Uncharacterized protein n=1 Tax=Entamoeba invadens IP1 TaxID=370355 RepID=L7FLZ9_ENTIV|nr:hypothetical protein EIN_334810 [Entamoeba invadens IP1]ELP88539.1 hypothetical protein EIN_334810 [Entamoeba invadens IP1]|eukprot:XP_004255310.1 hypothetical protein EIN_334810 [Entamoeba invadens IP1]
MGKIYTDMFNFCEEMEKLRNWLIGLVLPGLFTSDDINALERLFHSFKFILDQLEIQRITERKVIVALMFIEPILDVFISRRIKTIISSFWRKKYYFYTKVDRAFFREPEQREKAKNLFKYAEAYIRKFANEVIAMTRTPLLVNAQKAQQIAAKMESLLSFVNNADDGYYGNPLLQTF